MSCESVNGAWLDFTGLTLEHALGGGWSHSVHPEDLGRWLGEEYRVPERQVDEREDELPPDHPERGSDA